MNAKEVKKGKAEELTNKLTELIRENLVGITEKTAPDVLRFRLPNGQVFEIRTSEVENL